MALTYLNSGLAQNNPMHFYIQPSQIQILENGEYINVEDYTAPDSVIDFTFDYSIFNTSSFTYNPFALHLGIAVVNNKFNYESVEFADLRLKGGGLKPLSNKTKTVDDKPNILNFADLNSGKGHLYPRGGYVIVKIPKEVKENFRSIEDIYSIVRSNLTAGIAFDIHDMDGNDWRTL